MGNGLSNDITQLGECEPKCPIECESTPDDPPPMTQSECDLQCTKERKKVNYVEYVGPVHISLIDPPGYVYRRTMLETALLNMAYFFMGSTVMVPLYYTLSFKHFWPMNVHILLATLGSQIFLPAYFLILNYLDGPGIFLKSKDKRAEACWMNFLGIIFVWVGNVGLYFYKDYFLKVTVHGVFGLLGFILCGLNFLSSICLIADEDSALGKFAQFTSVPAYLALTVAFITGLFKPGMVKWYPEKNMPAFLSMFCLAYTMIILYRPVKDFCKLM